MLWEKKKTKVHVSKKYLGSLAKRMKEGDVHSVLDTAAFQMAMGHPTRGVEKLIWHRPTQFHKAIILRLQK